MVKAKAKTKKSSQAKRIKISRQTHVIDASGKVLGRLASEITVILIGKNKPSYKPNIDMGDNIIIKNIKKIKISGNKLDQKIYYRHSTYPGGLKRIKMRTLFEKDPAQVLKKAVFNMLPKNRLRKDRIKRLTIS